MTIETWLQDAIADAGQRGLPELKSILEGLALSTRALRAADFNDDASGRFEATADGGRSDGDKASGASNPQRPDTGATRW
jgi:hypothetical protein